MASVKNFSSCFVKSSNTSTVHLADGLHAYRKPCLVIAALKHCPQPSTLQALLSATELTSTEDWSCNAAVVATRSRPTPNTAAVEYNWVVK